MSPQGLTPIASGQQIVISNDGTETRPGNSVCGTSKNVQIVLVDQSVL